LNTVVSNITNGFQDGSIGAALNLNISSVEINEPIFVPTEENVLCPGSFPQDVDPNGECYFGPDINVQSGTPWSQASQEQAALILEENLRSSSLKVPSQLRIMTQPGQAFEISPLGVQPKLFTVDQDGKFISELGTVNDPWIVSASKLSGDGNLVNNVTCAFANGYCEFTDMAVDTSGYNFTIEFEVIYPLSTSLTSVVSDEFSIGGRKLSLRIMEIPSLQPQNTTFTASVNIWDDGLDGPVDSSNLPPTPVSCSVSLMGAPDATLEGVSQVTAVDGVATFDDLKIEGVAEEINLQFFCEDQSDFSYTVTSDSFSIHDYPDTGMLRVSDTGFEFEGKAEALLPVLDAISSFINAASQDAKKQKLIDIRSRKH